MLQQPISYFYVDSCVVYQSPLVTELQYVCLFVHVSSTIMLLVRLTFIEVAEYGSLLTAGKRPLRKPEVPD